MTIDSHGNQAFIPIRDNNEPSMASWSDADITLGVFT